MQTNRRGQFVRVGSCISSKISVIRP